MSTVEEIKSAIEKLSPEQREELELWLSGADDDEWDRQMKADAAAKMDDVKARMDKRSTEIDADMAATDADMAEADATAAIDYAAWTIDNARLAVLDAIDARANANTRAGTAAS